MNGEEPILMREGIFKMSLYNQFVYKAEVQSLRNENDVIELLRDVRNDLNIVDERIEDKSLLQILRIAESGNYEASSGALSAGSTVDLGAAARLLREWREKSASGCRGCAAYKASKELGNETYLFCREHETRSDVDEVSGHSPRIARYGKTGCKELKQKFRPLEKVVRSAR